VLVSLDSLCLCKSELTLSYLFLIGFSVGSNLWLSDWSNQPPAPDGRQNIATRDLYLGVYGGLGFAQGSNSPITNMLTGERLRYNVWLVFCPQPFLFSWLRSHLSWALSDHHPICTSKCYIEYLEPRCTFSTQLPLVALLIALLRTWMFAMRRFRSISESGSSLSPRFWELWLLSVTGMVW
jgi:hypothetical protein